MIYLAITDQSWGFSNDRDNPATADQALARAKSGFRGQFRANRTPHYVLAFPDGTEVNINGMGGWYSDKKPVAIVTARNLPADRVKLLEDMVTPAEITVDA